MVWYKLTTGIVLQFIAKSSKYQSDVQFYNEFDDGRFSVLAGKNTFHLNISATRQKDIGTYNCGKIFLNNLLFADGILKTVIQQPVSESVQPGDSVTLNCTIHTETCAGEHSVYWFRHGSGESRPGIIYTHGDRSDQCEKSSEAGSPTQSCFYNLPKKNLSLSDAGTYYCAVASCGEILFGNGTKLDIHEYDFPLTHTALALVTSNIVFVIVIILLTCGICNERTRGPKDVTKSSEISQPAPFLAAKLGDNVTVECHVTSNVDHMVWYKMTTGKKLQCVAKADIYYKYLKYFDEFKDGRFAVLIETRKCHLTISAMKPEDIGIYYCGVSRSHFLNTDTVVQQPVSESVQPGDSVTLNCTIHTETCTGEHSVYWFRHGSGESRPGIIYTHGDRSDQCEKFPNAGSPTQSCVYNLPKRNLSLSDAGTYYCAVASCGEILFGDGTKMDIEVPEHDSPFDLSPTVLSLVVSNIVLGIVTLLLNQDSDVLNYAAVSFTPKNNSSSRRAREKTSREDAVYSEVRYLQQQ
ncbi:unnamed protein product [Coregonus sp. 'balchen']|nr:unnamed protein product [Coregonus sp. 'balchen']